MKITEKINLDGAGLIEHGPITIVAFGDSMTHGALGEDEFDYELAYWNRLKKKIISVRDFVPVNVINAGIGGTNAKWSLERIDKQVLAHNPDLVIVCFGLNDVVNSLEDYMEGLEGIFDKCLKSGAEVIFMTPNMLNTTVIEGIPHYSYAIKTAQIQNEGRMDMYMEKAIDLAEKMGVTVCDCYKEWKKLSETQDITYLLANRINHPSREMHELFAQKLFETIFAGTDFVPNPPDSTMCKEAQSY